MYRTVGAPVAQALLLLVCALSCAIVYAEGGWSLSPKVSLEANYDDNLSLHATAPNTVRGLRLSAAAGLSRSWPVDEISAVIGADFIDYTGEDVPSEEGNQFVQLYGRHRSRRTTWNLDADLKHDSPLRTIELPTAPGAETPIGDIGVAIVTLPVERYRLMLKPSWTYDLTPRDNLQLDYELSSEWFDETAGANVVDYNTHTLRAGLGHRISADNRVSARVQVQRFEPENRQSTDSYELLADLSHDYSAAGRVGIELGIRRVTEAERETDETGFVTGVSWGGKMPVAAVLVKLERRLYPNSFGEVVETDQVTAGWTQRLTRTTQLHMKGRAFDTRSISANGQHDQAYAQIDTGLRHSLDRRWSIRLAYRYRWVDREMDREAAASNGLFLSIGYDTPLAL